MEQKWERPNWTSQAARRRRSRTPDRVRRDDDETIERPKAFDAKPSAASVLLERGCRQTSDLAEPSGSAERAGQQARDTPRRRCAECTPLGSAFDFQGTGSRPIGRGAQPRGRGRRDRRTNHPRKKVAENRGVRMKAGSEIVLPDSAVRRTSVPAGADNSVDAARRNKPHNIHRKSLDFALAGRHAHVRPTRTERDRRRDSCGELRSGNEQPGSDRTPRA
jgi:hypothetical protein